MVICRYITQEGNKLEVAKCKVPTTVTNAVSWRSEGIRYKKNEVFIDVIESINVLVSLLTMVIWIYSLNGDFEGKLVHVKFCGELSKTLLMPERKKFQAIVHLVVA